MVQGKKQDESSTASVMQSLKMMVETMNTMIIKMSQLIETVTKLSIAGNT